MIITALLSLLKGILSLFLFPFNIPGAPDDLSSALPIFLDYLSKGESFFNLVLPINILPFFLVFSAIFTLRHGYLIAVWVLRKIPLLNMK